MFFSGIVAASILAFSVSAAPAPIVSRQAESTSRGIRLAVDVIGTDFTDGPVQGLEITTAHTGAGLNRAVAQAGAGTVFYSNGTETQVQNWLATLINDTPTFPQAFVIMYEGAGGASGAQFEVEISAKQDPTRVPSDGMQVPTAGPVIIDPLGASPDFAVGTFIICKDAIPATGLTDPFNALYWNAAEAIPESCITVNLVPKCDTLADLPAGLPWNHDNVRESRCLA
jgi:hypothetical protein